MTQMGGSSSTPLTSDNGSGPNSIGPSQIKDKYDKASRSINSECQRYWQNLAFLQGEQWVYWNKVRNRLEELDRDESRVRVVINRLGSTVRRLVAKSMKQDLVFEVPPTAADDATVRGARIGESILGDLHREQNWELLREEVTIATLGGGTGLFCLDWDTSAGQELEVDDQTGRTIGIGDVKVTALSVVEAVTEPGTKNIETANWWIKAQALPTAEVKEQYKLPQMPAADATQAMSPVQQKILQVGQTTYQPKDMALVLTYYERPNSQNKAGQVAVVVGGKFVDGPHPWPFSFTDRLNVVCSRESKVLGRWTGDTVLSHAVPVQAAYNMVWSSILEHAKLAGNARVLWPQMAGDMGDSLTDLPGEIIEYVEQSNGAKPEWWSPPQLPAGQVELGTMLAQQMDDILGVNDVSRGIAPRNVQSGQGLAILSEQDDTPLTHVVSEVADAFARLASMILELYADKVTETRKARVDYPHQVSETVSWTGDDLQNQTNVVVPADAVQPTSEAVVWTKAQTLFNMGAFNKNGVPDMGMFARYLSSSGNEQDFTETTNPYVAKAQRENYMMALGEVCLPVPWDDHTIHIEILNDYRQSSSFDRLDEATQALFQAHAMAHQNLAAETAAMSANRQMQGMTPDLAAAPTADGGNGGFTPGPGQPMVDPRDLTQPSGQSSTQQALEQVTNAQSRILPGQQPSVPTP